MAEVIETLRQEKKLVAYLDTGKYKKVRLIFWHGLGDLVMFMNPYAMLKGLFNDIEFDLAVPEGLTYETAFPELSTITGDEMKTLKDQPYDLVALIHFPMNEGQTEYTKGEWCCTHELGITPMNGHTYIKPCQNRLVAVHFQITCLPDAANPDKETAHRIWKDITEAGYIPIETHFTHCFHNPVNEKFDFVTAHVREARAEVSSLVGLLQHCGAFVGVVSGNFHVALSVLPEDKIFYLEKDFKLECFTHKPIARANVKPGEYKGEVKPWLANMRTS